MEYTNLQGSFNNTAEPVATRAYEIRKNVDRRERAKTTYASTPVLNSNNLILNRMMPKDFDALRPFLRRVFVGREQFLQQQDEPVEYVYFPETAAISEFRLLDDGRMVEVALTGPEGIVGLTALDPNSYTSNCIQVSQPGIVLRVESSTLRTLGQKNPELNVYFHSSIENYVRQITSKSVCNMFHTVEERFCTWLLMLQDRCGESRLKLTHEQIARTLGVYRSCVTMVAIDMRKKLMIDYLRGAIIIQDRKLIERSACQCYLEMAIH